MRLDATPLSGVYVVVPEPAHDERGFFARTYSAVEMSAAGLDARVAQCSVSYNRLRGTLRGMHFQRAPHGESKLVRCTRGAIYDVVVDLRADSPTYRQWHAQELTADNRLAMYVPDGVAHGFLTLADDTEVSYQISVPYVPAAAAGVRWDDPALNITWPEPVLVMSDRDRAFPLLHRP